MLPNVSDPTVDYGLPKTNRDALGPVDPEKEIDSAEYERAMVDLAALTQCSARVVMRVKFTAGAPSIEYYRSCWGSDVAVQPTATDNGDGDVMWTWTPTGYDDLNPTPDRRETRAPAFIGAHVTLIHDDSVKFAAPSIVTSANKVRVYTANTAGVMTDCDYLLSVY